MGRLFAEWIVEPFKGFYSLFLSPDSRIYFLNFQISLVGRYYTLQHPRALDSCESEF